MVDVENPDGDQCAQICNLRLPVGISIGFMLFEGT